MSTYIIELEKSEIEQAILDYVNHEVTIQGRKQLVDPKLSFSNKDGDIGFFKVSIEATGKTKELPHA